MTKDYLDTIRAGVLINSLFFDFIKNELDSLKVYDINNTQCFILYNIGDSTITIREIMSDGYYIGTNISYNLKKMLENDYVISQTAIDNKLRKFIHLSEKGLILFKKIDCILKNHIKNMELSGINDKDVKKINDLLEKMERFYKNILFNRRRF